MNINPLKKGVLTVNNHGIGEVSDALLRERALEIAIIEGRSDTQVTEADWDQAERELSGETGMDPQEAILEAAPESERWDPVPGFTGHSAPQIISDEEDEEGRSDEEALVEEGVREAEHDQMLQAARAGQKEDES
jgi:Protein of unknown function (DUF2934)